MKKFISKILGFSLTFCALFLIIHSLVNFSINGQSDKGTLYVWGDSLIHRGLDFELLADLMEGEVQSASEHGLGVYDLLNFTDNIPDNSKVLLVLSKTTLLRLKNRDRNESGISWWGIKTLWQNGYSISELITIIKSNLLIRNNFHCTTDLYPFSEEINTEISISRLVKSSIKIPSYLEGKQNIYLAAINRLQEKGCEINFINYPFSDEFENHLKGLESIKNIRVFENKVLKTVDITNKDILQLNLEKQVMYDHTHLNENGARQTTRFVAKVLAKDGSHFIEVLN